MADQNPVALVTGANQGIGLQIAKELAANGFTVLVGSRDIARGETAARSIEGDVRAVQLDVTDEQSIAAAAQHIGEAFDRLDLLVNNAAISRAGKVPGVSPRAPIEEYAAHTRPSNVPLDEIRAVWDTNVFGPLRVYQAMLPLLKKAPYARIINVSSAVGSMTLNSDPNFLYRGLGPVYPCSKAALNALTIAMAIELESTSIKVNAVSPGFTKTGLNGFAGTDTVEEGAAEVVRIALLGPEGPTGTFTHATLGNVPW